MSFISQFNVSQAHKYRRNWVQIFILGLLLIVLGAVAISVSTLTTLLTTVFLGFIIFFSGVVLLFDSIAFWWKKWSGFFTHLLFAILYIGVGFMLVRNPEQGAITLTGLLGIFYVVVGIFRIGFYSAFQGPRWGWGWLNGILTLLIGVVIFTSWPISGLFIIGLFVGIDLIFAGWSYISVALASKYFEPN